MIIDEIREIKSGTKELRSFSITMGVVLGLLGGLLWWRGKEYYIYFLALSGIFFLFRFFMTDLLRPVYKAWMTIAVLIGWVMTRVILCIAFFLIFTPVGLIPRLFGRQFLELKPGNSEKSYWKYREPKEFKKSDYEKQF